MLKKPLITEKSMSLAKTGQYTFEVLRSMTKFQIARLVKDKFKVDVMSVKTINVPTKQKLQRSRKGYYTTDARKKAVVQVKKGQKIAIFEQAQPEEEVEVKTGEGEPIAKIKEKKSLLRGTKVRVEKMAKEEKIAEEGQRGQADFKTSHVEKKKKGTK